MVETLAAFVGTAGTQDAQIRTFLIADVRGYTVFTQERGDEAAAGWRRSSPPSRARSVEARGGTVVELRGDEALAVFDSARQAIRASIDLQRRFVDETVADPTLPLPVGIGLEPGRPSPVEDGFRGGALNLAARLCSIAGPAEILASRGGRPPRPEGGGCRVRRPGLGPAQGARGAGARDPAPGGGGRRRRGPGVPAGARRGRGQARAGGRRRDRRQPVQGPPRVRRSRRRSTSSDARSSSSSS